MTTPNSREFISTKLNLETAQIPWRELQRFFASGKAIAVAAELDLMQVATELAADNAAQLKQWMAAGQVDVVSDEQARQWFEEEAQVWTLVLKPWVLVQRLRVEDS